MHQPVDQAPIAYAYRIYPERYEKTISRLELDELARSDFQTHLSSRFSELHWLSEKVLLVPFRAFIHCKSYFWQPYPGENKDVSTLQCTAKKVAAFFGAAVTCLPAVPSLVLGLSLRLIEHGARPLLCYLKNEDIEDLSPPMLSKEEPLHVACLNVSFTPSSVNIEMDMRPPCVRALEIAESIIHDTHRPSVLFIEEGWNEDALRLLCSNLASVYPHILHSTAPQILGMSSGISVFSMYPIEEAHYVRFGDMVGTHGLPPRGLLRIRLATHSQKPLYLYGGIHTQSMDGFVYSQARLCQVKQLAALAKTDREKDPGCLQVFLGDFNSSVVDMHGYDNRRSEENKVLTYLDAEFTDPFLKDHDPVSGRRTTGSTTFLADDNARMGRTLSEPEASWYDGPFTALSDRLKIERELALDAVTHHSPKREIVVGKELPHTRVWGTKDWYDEQSALRPRYDYILLPKNETLDATVEIRRLNAPKGSQSSSSDHLLVSALLWLK